MSSFGRACALGFALLCGLMVLPGCNHGNSEAEAKAPASNDALPSDEQLRAMLDEELNFAVTKRALNLEDHGAWQIMHGVLPFGTKFKIYNKKEPVLALQWVLEGNAMRGWQPELGTENLNGRRGLRMALGGDKSGQGHPDQWLAIMANSGLPSTQKIIFQDQEFDIRDLVQQAMWDLYDGKEASWTLSSLITYLGPEYLGDNPKSWKASDGQEWTIERIVAMEAKQDLGSSACGGTHRLTGLNKALKEHLKSGGSLTGGWKAADEKLKNAVATSRQFQQPDGSLSNNFFTRAGWSPDPIAQMYSTGHTLEFLALSLPDSELDAPWVKRAVVRLCKLFRDTRPVDIECGSLYHATNGLLKYRQRKFGPWTYPE